MCYKIQKIQKGQTVKHQLSSHSGFYVLISFFWLYSQLPSGEICASQEYKGNDCKDTDLCFSDVNNDQLILDM